MTFDQTKIDSNELGRVLSDTSMRWRKLVENKISALGLAYGEFRVLRVLGDSGTCSMVKLAREQMITQAGMTSIVDRLENQGLIERVRCKTDRRVINIGITRKGGRLLEAASRLNRELVERAVGNLTEQEIKQLVITLKKMLTSAESNQSQELVGTTVRPEWSKQQRG